MKKTLCKKEKGGLIFGVCNGLADYFNMDVSIMRLIWVGAIFFAVGSPVFVYFLLAIILPDCSATQNSNVHEVHYQDVDDEDDETDEFGGRRYDD